MKNLLLQHFQHIPTQEQEEFFMLFSHFSQKRSAEIFILKGYAGTGKSTVTKSIVDTLKSIYRTTVLLAPTGRSAKVLQHYAQQSASTIHSHLYQLRSDAGGSYFFLKPNKLKNTLFIVDEASMISNQAIMNSGLSGDSLLDDLIRFVFQPNSNNQLLLIGDTAQLPPVHSTLSPALSIDDLAFGYQKKVAEYTLTEVIRQQKHSVILENATHLRDLLTTNQYEFQLKVASDCQVLQDRYEVESVLSDCLQDDADETLIVVRSNKRANLYNQQIRNQILMRESILEKGDKLMVLRNNYSWLPENSTMGFIANGEMLEILKVHSIIELYGFQFAKVRIIFPDYPHEKPLETVLLLDTLQSETPALTFEQRNQLYQNILEDYEDETSKAKKIKKVKENPYFNALEVKYAYAVTCHKAQGGQWNTVFIEQPYAETYDESYIRWLYTAITRAKEKVILLGFKEENLERE